jgi:hypothetical protein
MYYAMMAARYGMVLSTLALYAGLLLFFRKCRMMLS